MHCVRAAGGAPTTSAGPPPGLPAEGVEEELTEEEAIALAIHLSLQESMPESQDPTEGVD
jgi:Ubiquitin interaction motif